MCCFLHSTTRAEQASRVAEENMKFRYSLSCVDGKTNVLTVTPVLLISRKKPINSSYITFPSYLEPAYMCVHIFTPPHFVYIIYPLFFLFLLFCLVHNYTLFCYLYQHRQIVLYSCLSRLFQRSSSVVSCFAIILNENKSIVCSSPSTRWDLDGPMAWHCSF